MTEQNESEVRVSGEKEARFDHRVVFEPGYNYLHETGPRRRGQHGMGIRFSLIGEAGATQFLMNTMWTPLGEIDKASSVREAVHCDHFDYRFSTSGLVRPPSGMHVGIHWRTPLYDDDTSAGKCDLWDGECYYDASFGASDAVLRDFIAEGDKAVWRHLEEWYESRSTPAPQEES